MGDTKAIIDGKICLYSYLDKEKMERVLVQAQLPENVARDWEGSTIYLINWKIEKDSPAIIITYQTRNDAYAPIFDIRLPVVQDSSPIRPPNRSKNWRFDPYSECWKNIRTGEKRYI